MSNLQQELLKLYAAEVPEEDLLHIQRYLARYFAFKAIGEADELSAPSFDEPSAPSSDETNDDADPH